MVVGGELRRGPLSAAGVVDSYAIARLSPAETHGWFGPLSV
jgi:hypothetical protein